MLFETIDTAAKNPLVTGSPVIREALDFAKTLTPDHETGTFDLRGKDFYVMVQKRDTSPREQRAQPEAHQEYVDLQYCIGGGEIIDWYPLAGLNPATDYNREKDFQLFERPAGAPLPLSMKPGRFALFFPEDAHVPAIHDGINSQCNMVVFKIRLSEF